MKVETVGALFCRGCSCVTAQTLRSGLRLSRSSQGLVRKQVFFVKLYHLQMITLPRQARDKHRENS
jgi:hypothetical protein